MKILVVCQHYWPENFRITEISEALAQMGHEVTAVVGRPNYPTGIIPKEYRWFRNRKQSRNGVSIRRCYEIGRKQSKMGLAINYVSYMVAGSFKALMLAPKVDVIFAYSTSPVLMSMPAALASRIYRKKMVINVLDIWPACLSAMNVPETSILYRFMTPVSRFVYASAQVLLYSSKRFQQYLKRVHDLHVPDEWYLPQFADDAFSQGQDIQMLPKEEGRTHLVFAGNIGQMQSVETFIQTADLLRDEPIGWHIIGDGSNEQACRDLAEDLNLGDRVRFYGRRPLEEMPSFYAMADAMLISMKNDPLVSDTLPGKVQGYMAAGKPVLGSITGEAAYVIHKASCGLCAEPEDAEAFATLVRTFIAMPPEERKACGEHAKAYYQQFFTKQQHMQHLEAVLRSLVEG